MIGTVEKILGTKQGEQQLQHPTRPRPINHRTARRGLGVPVLYCSGRMAVAVVSGRGRPCSTSIIIRRAFSLWRWSGACVLAFSPVPPAWGASSKEETAQVRRPRKRSQGRSPHQVRHAWRIGLSLTRPSGRWIDRSIPKSKGDAAEKKGKD